MRRGVTLPETQTFALTNTLPYETRSSAANPISARTIVVCVRKTHRLRRLIAIEDPCL